MVLEDRTPSMRLNKIISYGTVGYPENVARQLRALNVTTLIASFINLVFAILSVAIPQSNTWVLFSVNFGAFVGFACVPFLHRFGARLSAVAFISIAYAFVLFVLVINGTGGYAWLYYISASALSVVFLGTERPSLSVGFCIVAVILVTTSHVFLPTSTGLVAPELFGFVGLLVNVSGSIAILYATVQYAMRQVSRAEREAERERSRSESLLRNILPEPIVQLLKDKPGQVIADRYEPASILFADIAGFTRHAAETSPEELVLFLNGVFTAFDELVDNHGLEKVKTSGDSYLVVSGVPIPRPDHADALARFALDLRKTALALGGIDGRGVPLRMGIASGPVVAGVIGTRKFFYDVWGDAVNMAARMETTGVTGRIQVAPETAVLLKDRFRLAPRGPVEVRGKGTVETWFLEAENPQ